MSNHVDLLIPAKFALFDAILKMGYDPNNLDRKAREDVANRLSTVARKNPPWHEKYIHNVLAGTLPAGKKLYAVIIKLQSLSVEIPYIVTGNVEPGALILADSRRCEYPPCNVVFVPRMPNQKYHCDECKRAMKKLRSYKSRAIIK
ncbi:MAG: hypothetical protein WC107_05560 [Patescibacteria group bacterium]